MQKYCPDCSELVSRERQTRWDRQNPRSVESIKRNDERITRRQKAQGAILNSEQAATIFWPVEVPLPDFSINIRVAVPFNYLYSKNAIWRIGKGGHVFLRKEAAKVSFILEHALRSALKDRQWRQRKTYLDILVQKHDHKGDAVNVVDAVCDAVKRAIGIDDRWFCIQRLDWQIVKQNPRLYVGVSQDDGGDQQVCSFCGRILELESFWKNSRLKFGVGRECKDCCKVWGSRKAKKERKEVKKRYAMNGTQVGLKVHIEEADVP